MKINAGTVLFASDDTALDLAKEYITDNKLTNEFVAIRKFKQHGEYWISVVAKKEFELNSK